MNNESSNDTLSVPGATLLEWEEPRKAWHVTEARKFSLLSLILLFIIGFVFIFSCLAIAMKLHPPERIDKNTLTFDKLPVFSAGMSALCVAGYASLWWWAKLKVKMMALSIERTKHNSTKRWKYEDIKNYCFETLNSKTGVYTLVVLRNHKGKTWKIALDDTVDKAKIEKVLNEHRIPKLEQVT